ncbi:Teichoic acids export ATP-binding protein TagH [Acaryochloris thomasi RCC1774]|uniref:Teichoic acids export ATP-binding protein TagH n=1 Tax=Acaryochloris thomasi RCC1774 TaxID=1764569 RepID=A0A2W1JU62_9CYAN|nr:ABC transporter ATP-binding protein [Acaryochloris thomasi]PZD72391.1 Teichoic acids export ATP-binding protein TagH [Acaryochloris thomasi RCC1774]
MSETVIKAENLGKKYIIGYKQAEQSQYKALRDVLADRAKAVGRYINPLSNNSGEGPTKEDFWALSDVSFEIKQGDRVGIIGRNGAGKSTLLKVLSRITEPTTGRIFINGRVASLLEVGTGFHPELTGRENIYLNGAILGMSRFEIKRKFEEIVDFAEVEKFLDTPVKRYSSGMYVRLAFAVAAHLEPEILVVDEVLAVGDIAFQNKCLGKMEDIATNKGRTVLFVSHNMGAVTQLCQSAFWIENGTLRANDNAEHIVAQYLSSNATKKGEKIWKKGIANLNVNEFLLKAIRIVNNQGKITSHIDPRSDFYIEIEYDLLKDITSYRIGVTVNTFSGVKLFDTYDVYGEEIGASRCPGRYVSRCKIPGNFLNSGQFSLKINAGMRGVKNFISIDSVLYLEIADISINDNARGKNEGLIRSQASWKTYNKK